MKHPTVLVFVEFPDPRLPTDGFLEHLLYPNAELIGSYHVADDETVETVRADREAAFTARLNKEAERFEQHGIRTNTEVVFNRDEVETRRRVAEADDVDAVLLPGGAHTLGEVLIPLRDLRNAEKKAEMLSIIEHDDLLKIELLHIVDPDETDETSKQAPDQVLQEAEGLLVERGISTDKIDQTVRESADTMFELNRAAAGYDLALLGQSQRDIEQRVFGPVADYVAENNEAAVLIVR